MLFINTFYIITSLSNFYIHCKLFSVKIIVCLITLRVKTKKGFSFVIL